MGNGRAADVDVELVDLLQKVVGRIDVGVDLGVEVAGQALDLAADPGGFVEEVLGVEDRLRAREAGGRIVGGGRSATSISTGAASASSGSAR